MADDDDNFGDGWDEDLDELIDDEEEDFTPAPTPAHAPAPAPAPAPVPISQQQSGTTAGWGEVDNSHADTLKKEGEEGWGDDLDLDDLDVDGTERVDDVDPTIDFAVPMEAPNSMFNKMAAAAPVPVPAPGPAPIPPAFAEEEDDFRWEEDEDVFTDANQEEEVLPPSSQPPPMQTPPPVNKFTGKINQVHDELIAYVEALMVTLPSIKAVLMAEYNHPHKAAELLHYYQERPNLRKYTIEKELPRMDYRVVLHHSNATTEENEPPIVVDDKREIERLFRLQPELDVLVRCANQSLLADLLKVMTDPDGLVRPQYMATCLAQSCQFVLECQQGTEGGTIRCNTELVLSLPEPSGNRYEVARIRGSVLLGIPTHPQHQAPMLEYDLKTMRITLNSMEKLRSTAEFLVESGWLEHPPVSPFPDTPAGANMDDNDTFRDVFLQQSQTVSLGLSAAWKQIDAVAGLQNKMNLVKNIAGDGSLLEQAMQEQEEYHRQMEEEARQRQQQSNNIVPVSSNISATDQQGLHPLQQQPQARPKSLLGSFMGKLASSVAIPDEDPSIYGQPQSHPPRQGIFPRPPMYPAGSFSRQAVESAETAGSFSRPAIETTGSFPRPRLEEVERPFPRPQLNKAPDKSAKPAAAKQPASSWSSQMATQAQEITPSPVPATDDENLALDDGWDDDVDLTLDDESSPDQPAKPAAERPPVSTATLVPAAPAISTTFGNERKELARPIEPSLFTKEDDIVETRKRWVNPGPGRRCLPPALE